MPLPLFLIGLVLLYLGERALAGTSRIVADGLGAALLLLSLSVAVLRFAKAKQAERRSAARNLLFHYGLGAVAVLAYFAQTEEFGLFSVTGENRVRNLIMVLWPVVLVIGLGPAIAMELALRSLERAPRLELWRLRLAARSARIIVLGLVTFAGVNYAASQWNRKIDLSYFKTTKLGTANQKLLAGLGEKVTILLFYTPGNDVLEHVQDYVHELQQASEFVDVQVIDQALHPNKARDYKVRSNGYVVVASNGKHESLRLGDELEAARKRLKTLDADMHERLMKISRPPRIAYLTTGHLERDYSPSKDDTRMALHDFKDLLQTLGFKVKRLGLADGLGSKIPEDASVVIIAGPTEEFLKEEIEALHAYLRQGGRLMAFMDPDHGITGDALLAPLGVKVSKDLVATDDPRHIWGQRQTPFSVATNKVSTHPSVTSLSATQGRYGMMFNGTGAVEKLDKPPKDARITFTVRSMPKSWIDLNKNGKFDQGMEKRATVDYVAAIAIKNSATKEIKEGKEPAKKPQPTRAVVVADADFMGNLIIRNQGNYALVMDGLRWLAGDEGLAGEIESEKDVRIVHRKDEDAKWFYGSSLLVPAAIFFGGLVYTSRSRRRKS